MGRVEMRMYRRRQKRAKWLKWLGIILLLGGIGGLLWWKGQASFATDLIGLASATPESSAFDRTVETREVTMGAETWFAIQTGVFSTQEAAAQKADAYIQRGAPGTVIRQGEKWRVFIACYGSEADADAVKTRLENRQKVDTYLYSWNCPEIRLRLTGMAGQLDAVEAGFTLLISTASGLRDTAMELDAAQLSISEIAAALKSMEEQTALWEDTIRSRFGKQPPDLVQSMLVITGAFKEKFAKITSAEDATATSAALKAQAMTLYDEICVWREKLAAQ